MRKISAFYAFLAFVFMGVSMAVVPAHAQATGSGFCVYGKKNGGGINPSSLKLKQIESAPTADCTVGFYESWAAAYNYLNGWASIASNQVEGSFIEITSDLVFAGKSTDAMSCNTGNAAFNGKMLDLKDKIALVGASTSTHYKISGLCYIADADAEVGFVKNAKKVENLDFEDVYFKSEKGGSRVGIIPKNEQTAAHVYQNIQVSRSEFYGDYVGAILGEGRAYINNISLNDVVISGGNYAGGVAGQLTADALESADGADNNVYSEFSINSLKISPATSASFSSDHYFGGIAGYVTLDSPKEWNSISLIDLDIQGASYAGGLLGMVYYSAVAEDDSKFSEIYVGKKNAEKSTINATKYAGGLVGYINEGAVAGSAITVEKTSVNADVKGSGVDNSPSYVGGLIGFINYSSSGKMKLTINNNNIVGSVYGAGDDKKVGYLVGVLNYSNTDFKSVKYNYHYGDYDSGKHYAKIGIGSFEDGTNDNWLNPSVNTGSTAVISHNFRNEEIGKSAGTSLAKDGDLVNQIKPVQKTSSAEILLTESYYNGVISSSVMKKSDFTKVLNDGSGVATTGVWKSDGNELPYLNTSVVLAANNSYNVKFNIAAVEVISQTIMHEKTKANYVVFVPKDFNASGKTYSSYDPSEGDDLPKLHAVFKNFYDPDLQLNGNSNMQFFVEFDVKWTVWPDSSHCRIGSSVMDGQKTDYYCVQQESFQEFNDDLVTLAKNGNMITTGKTVELSPVWQGVLLGYSEQSVSTLDVECTPSSTYDCSEKPLDLVLSQKFEMGGQNYEFKQSTADGKILLPQKGMYEFDVDFIVNPGFKFDNPYKGKIDGIDLNEPNVFEIAYNEADKKISLGSNDAAPIYDLYYETDPGAKFGLVNYTVNFDFSNLLSGQTFDIENNRLVFDNSVDNEQDYDKVRGYVVFGNAWASNSWKSSKANMNVGKDARNFPNAYVYGFDKSGNAKFFKLRWGVDASKTDSYDYLTSALLKEALGDNLDATKIYAYAIDAENYMKNDNIATVSRRVINVFALGEKDEKLTAAKDYHGSIELSQEIGGVKFVQESKLFELAYPKYAHRLIIPQTTNAFDDTLTFDVSVNPDPGYEMTLEFNPNWANAPANEGWGYSPTEGRLKYLANSMSGAQFNIKYSLLHYNLSFTIPDNMLDKDLYVANNASSKLDWFDSQENVTVDDITAPTLYNSEGCRIGWVVEGEGIKDHHATTLADEVQYMTSTEKTSGFVNKLVPDVNNKSLCSDKDDSYTITLNVEGEGEISLQQKFGSENGRIAMTHFFTEKDGKLKLKVPKARYGAKNDETGVTLLIKANSATGYVFENVTIDGTTDAAQTKMNGDEIIVAGDMNLTARFIKLEPVYVAYDLSLENKASDSANTYLPVGATNKESIQLNSPTDVYTLWKPYRKDMCFGGWSLIKPNGTQTSNNPVLNEFSYSYLGDFSKDESKPTKLYAIWNDCQSNPKPTISVGTSSANMTLVLYQVFGKDTLRHEMKQFGITLNGEAFDFYIDTVRSVPAVGYVIDHSKYTLSYKVQGQSNDYIVKSENNAWRVTPEIKETGTVTARTYTFTPTVKKVTYELVFNENAGSEKQFFGDSWKVILTEATFDADNDGNWTVKQAWTVNTTERKFPMAIYREGYCLQGYTLAKNDKTEGVWTELTDTFMQNYAKLAASGSIPMYAYWEACDQGFTVYAVDADKGTLTLSRTFDIGGSDKKAVRTYEVGANGLKIPSTNGDISFTGISFTVNNGAGVILDTEKPYTYREHGSTGKWNEFNGALAVSSDLDIQAPLYMDLFNSTYALDMNATDVFYGDGFDAFTWTAVAFGDKLPTNVYRTDAKLVGWSFEKDATADKAITVFDKKFVEIFESYENANQFGVNFDPTKKVYPVLFAIWETGVQPTWTVKADEKNKGKLSLEQSIGDKNFAYAVDKELLVPAVDNAIEFFVRYEADDNWILNVGESLVWKDANGNEHATENESFQRIDNDYVVSALENAKEFNLVFDASTEDALYYGSDWAKEYEKVDGNGSKAFPTMAYSMDKCLAGWSVTPDGSIYKEMNHALVEEIYEAYPNLDEKTKVKLYDRWTDDVQSCAGNFTQVAVKSEHGSIELIEKTEKGNIVHKFDDNGQVLVPSEIESDKWTLRVIPDEGYDLDSIVVKKNGKVETILKEGSNSVQLPKEMENVIFTAYFKKKGEIIVKKDSVKIVNEQFHTSGNTLQFDFSSSEFDADRDVSVSVKVIDMQTGWDTLIYKPVTSDFAGQFTIHVVKPGSYKAVLTLSDGDNVSDEKTRFFTVRSPFESVEPQSWHMLSYSSLDPSAIVWDDVHFYRWDEGGIGEFWQYKSVHSGETLDATQGVWYSSMSGEPLVLRSDYQDDDKDIVWDLECKNSGWNLVANPHGWYVDLYSSNRNKKTAPDEESEVTFYRYIPETGGYEENIERLKPYEAVWAKVSKKTKWVVSAEPVFVDDDNGENGDNAFGEGVLTRTLAKSAAKNKWTLQLALSDDKGKRDSWNLLGVSDHPFNAEEPPASMGDHVNLSIVSGKRGLAKSIKAPTDDLEWTVALSASSIRNGYLTIGGIDGVKSLGYKVFVTVDGETTEMQEGKSLPVLLKSNSKTATVRVTKGTPTIAKNSLIKGLQSAKLGNKMHVSFDAAESLAGSNARVELLDVKGKVKSAVSAKTLFGTNDVMMKAPQSGVYVLRVRVGAELQTRRIFVK